MWPFLGMNEIFVLSPQQTFPCSPLAGIALGVHTLAVVAKRRITTTASLTNQESPWAWKGAQAPKTKASLTLRQSQGFVTRKKQRNSPSYSTLK